MDENGHIKATTFVVQGRKQPLEEIRKKTLMKHEKYMRMENDEYYSEMTREEVVKKLKNINEYEENEGLTKMRKKLERFSRTRHLQIWHDHSTLANSGHILFTISCLYDPALYLTDDEYLHITGKKVNIQAVIEKPQVYIVARCKSCDVEQLAYVDTRVCCLQNLQKNLEMSNGVQVKDVMRFFHGDSPAQEFESGQQKGGYYYCSGCAGHSDMVYDLEYSFRCERMTITPGI